MAETYTLPSFDDMPNDRSDASIQYAGSSSDNQRRFDPDAYLKSVRNDNSPRPLMFDDLPAKGYLSDQDVGLPSRPAAQRPAQSNHDPQRPLMFDDLPSGEEWPGTEQDVQASASPGPDDALQWPGAGMARNRATRPAPGRGRA